MHPINMGKNASAVEPEKPRLLDILRTRIRLKHYSLRTEHTYIKWAKRYILFHGKRHPAEMGKVEVEAFLSHLAVEHNVSASTKSQARAAILFLYREILDIELPWLDDVEQAKKPQRLPVVLTVSEVQALLSRLTGTHALMGRLMYGTGMRLMETVRLRVKDVDFERRKIIVREGKGAKDRITMLPKRLQRRGRSTWRGSRGYTTKTCGPASVRSTSPMPSGQNTRMRDATGDGSMCSRQSSFRGTRVPG